MVAGCNERSEVPYGNHKFSAGSIGHGWGLRQFVAGHVQENWPLPAPAGIRGICAGLSLRVRTLTWLATGHFPLSTLSPKGLTTLMPSYSCSVLMSSE